MSFPIRDRPEQDPRMKPSVRNPPRNRGYFSSSPRAFSIEKRNISRSGYHSKFHRILRLPRKVTLELHQILRLPWKKLHLSLILFTHETLFTMRGITSVIVLTHQILRPPQKMTLERLEILHLQRKNLTKHWAVSWLSYNLTELLLDWAITWLSYYLTELWLDWGITWLTYNLTELWFNWAITWLNYDLTEL